MEIIDDQFGVLLLDLEDPNPNAWLTSVSLPYFKVFGKNLDLGRPKRHADRLDPEVLFRKTKFRLLLQCGSPPKPPTAAQRLAWTKVLHRGDALWNQVLRRIIAEYRLQRPTRLEAWQRMYGRTGITRALPHVTSAPQMKKLIRPFELTVLSSTDDEPAEVQIKCYCTWFNGLTVRVRDGRMTGFLRNPFCPDPIDLPPSHYHPTLGPLCWQHGAWHGHVRCNSFRHFMNVARWCTPDSNGPPDSTLGWDLARGEFPLKIFSAANTRPTRADVQALQEFKSREPTHAADIVQAIYEDYVGNYPTRVEQWLGPNVEYLLPELTSPADLLDLIELDSINISRSVKATDPTIAFEFSCTWSPGIGILWRKGKVLKIGPRHIARPRRRRAA